MAPVAVGVAGGGKWAIKGLTEERFWTDVEGNIGVGAAAWELA